MKRLLLFVVSMAMLCAPGRAALWTSENLLPNPGFEGAASVGEINWSCTAPGTGTGECAVDAGTGRAGTQAVKLGVTDGEFGLRATRVTLPTGAKRASFDVYVKLADSSPVYPAIGWHSEESLLKTSKGEPISGTCEWTRVGVSGRAPRGATWIECILWANDHSGVALVDDGCLRVEIKGSPPLDVLCNQVGYDPSVPVRILVQSRAAAAERGVFQVMDARGKTVFEGELSPVGSIPVWERPYALATIEALPPGDGYRVEAKMAGLTGRSYPFSVGAEVVQRNTLGPAAGFYYYQRCGCEVPGWHAPCHMDDARMPDGTHKDLTGAWHDAGDYNKYNSSGFAALSVYALAYAHERAAEIMDQHAAAKKLPSALEEAAWGADWLLKMENGETGRLWANVYAGRVETALYWGPPENETDNQPGTEDDRPVTGDPVKHNYGNHTASAALALLGRLTGEERYVQAAERMYGALKENEIAHANDAAFALLACLELEKARPAAGYAAKAKPLAERLLACQIRKGRYEGGFTASPGGENPVIGATTLGLPAAALSLYALAHGDDLAIRKALAGYLRFSERLADDPFEISKLVQNGEPVFFLSVPKGRHYVAQNSMYLMQAWALACAARFTENDAFLALATRHIDWVLGRNPFGVCMLEGQGHFNPPTYHHRYNSIPGHPRGAVPGAVCNGISRLQPAPDKPYFDMRTGIRRPSFETNEPWLPHNATYLLAVSSL